MKEWQMKFNEWWRNLSLHEQRVVAVGGAIAGSLLFYLIIWQPYLDRLETMRKQIQTEYKTLAWMQAADKEVNKLEKQTTKGATMTPIALLSVLQKQVDEASLATTLTQLKQATQDSVEMHFQKVYFDQMINLLIKVIKEQNVSITHLSVIADATPGIVNADIVLTLGS